MGDERELPVQADPPSPPSPEPEIPIGESEWVQRGGQPDIQTERS